jgi:hypothetical protein
LKQEQILCRQNIIFEITWTLQEDNKFELVACNTITYRGLFSGNPAVHWATTRQNESLSSPPARPPIAYLAK